MLIIQKMFSCLWSLWRVNKLLKLWHFVSVLTYNFWISCREGAAKTLLFLAILHQGAKRTILTRVKYLTAYDLERPTELRACTKKEERTFTSYFVWIDHLGSFLQFRGDKDFCKAEKRCTSIFGGKILFFHFITILGLELMSGFLPSFFHSTNSFHE